MSLSFIYERLAGGIPPACVCPHQRSPGFYRQAVGILDGQDQRRLAVIVPDVDIGAVPDDTWGSEFVSSALAHFAWSTPAKFRLNATDLTDYVEVQTADGGLWKDVGADGCARDATEAIEVANRLLPAS